MTELLDRKRSVTREDFLDEAQAGGVWVWNVLDPGPLRTGTASLPAYGSRDRDIVLANTPGLEDMWSIALSVACSKIAVRGYEIQDKDNSDQRVKRSQTWIRNLDGPADYRSGVVKVAQDFFTTNNGWFVEIERVSKSPGSRIRALWHLDSLRCWRTGHLEYPVIYQDMDGTFHKLRYDQVIFGADMSSARVRSFGRGRCAADRVFQSITTAAGMETYFHEKITGSRGLALYFVSGVSGKQLQDAMITSDAEQSRKGHVVYKGAVMVPIQGEQTINVAQIDLAGVPDGFDVNSQRDDYYLRFTKTLGLAAQGIKPLSGQGLGTGKQTEVLDDVTDEEGAIAFFTKQFEDKLNQQVMPETTTFSITVNDLRNQIRRAELRKMRADERAARIASGEITVQEARQLALDDGDISPQMVTEDLTPGGVLTDSGDQSKPTDQPRFAALPAAQAPAQPAVATMSKAADDVDALLDDELSGALDVLRKVAGGE